MPEETHADKNISQKHRGPSERTARFILGIYDWVRGIVASTTTSTPRGWTEHHQVHALAAGKTLRFPHILLAEDNPETAGNIIQAVKNHYVFGRVKIFVAHTYNAAVTFFENEDIDLVIMDADLDDEDGDGAVLTQKFLGARPGITILANSSSRLSNLKLTGFGAAATIGKDTGKLKRWLLINDPAGSGG